MPASRKRKKKAPTPDGRHRPKASTSRRPRLAGDPPAHRKRNTPRPEVGPTLNFIAAVIGFITKIWPW